MAPSSSGDPRGRGWLLRMAAEYGRELEGASTWARVVAAGMGEDVWRSIGLEKPQELAEDPRQLGRPTRGPGAGAAAKPQPAGVEGRSPSPYAHRGHLLHSAVPDAFTRTRARGSSVPSPVGGRPDEGALTRAVSRAVVRDPLDALRSAEQLRPWHDVKLELPNGRRIRKDGRSTQYLRETALRLAVEAATGREILDREGAPAPCLEDGHVEQHAKVTDAFRFRAHACRDRARCPHCGRVYGLEKSQELAALLEAAVLRAELTGRDAIGWGIVVTVPKVVSEHLGALASDPRTSGKPLRAELRKLVQIAKDYAARLLLQGRADDANEVRELGAAINLHWWSSSNPTSGWHWHAHVMVPNASRTGGKLRRLAKLSEEALATARAELGAALEGAWGDLEGAGRLAPNANVRWYLNTNEGWTKWRHRARYDARHPFADVLKLAKREPERVFADEELEGLRWVAERIEDLQTLKTRRYVGWLTPGRRKPEGLHRVEHEGESMWRPVELGWRKIVAVTDQGFVLAYRDGAGQVRTEVMGRDVVLDDVRRVEWEWHPTGDSPGRAPPVAA